MKRQLSFAVVAFLILAAALSVHAVYDQIATGTWGPAGALTESRSGAAAVRLDDGRVLFIGGSGANGPLSSAEALTAGAGFASIAPMSEARKGHTATMLSDGRVLVTGGENNSGATLTAEIYDPSSDSWSPAGALLTPRSGHTASLLKDGKVLIAGGENSGGPVNSLEVFDPVSNSFGSAGVLNAARSGHAAAVLSEGRVLIVGGRGDGQDGNPVTLSSTEIYDPEAGSVSSGASLSTARSGLSATTLLDGTVLAMGGNDGSQDLASAEIFVPATNTWTTTSSSAASTRSGHAAFLLPNNANVLIVGGSSAGNDLASAELYEPWSGNFKSTGSMAAAHAGIGGAAVGSMDGFLAIAGAGAPASGEVYHFATVKTDKDDYAPGTPVIMTGSGWQPGETVTLSLLEYPLLDTHPDMTAVADANGNISFDQWAPDEHDISVKFYLTAKGLASQAQTTFKDAIQTTTSIASSVNPSSLAQSVTFTATVTQTISGATVTDGTVTFTRGGNANCGGGGVIILATAVSLNGSGQASATTSFASAGTFDIHACYSGTGTNATALQSSTAVLNQTVNAATATTTAVTSSANPSTFGQSLTFTATVSPATGATAPTGTVQFKIDGTDFGSPVALSASGSNGVATSAAISTLNVAGSPHPVVAVYSPTGAFTGSTGPTLQQVVNKANQTITFGALGNKNYGDPDFLVSATGGASGNPVTFASTTPLVCTTTGTNGSTVHIVATGSCSIKASQAADANYNAAADVTQSFTVNKATFTVSIIGDSTKSYDGNTNATLTSANFSLSGLVGTDSFTVTKTTGTYNSKDVATAATVSTTLAAGDFTPVGGTLASNYTLPTTASGPGHITTKAITATLTAADKTYDATNAEPNASMSCSLTGVIPADSANVSCAATSGTFNTSQVLTANLVTATVTISGTASANYTLGASGTATLSTSATTTARITTKAITAALTAADKTYDGTNTEPDASMSCTLTGVIPTDTATVSCAASGGTFNTSQVASANLVTATLTISGGASSNYTLGAAGSSTLFTSATATAHITTKAITAALTAANKTYDGNNIEPDASMSCLLTGIVGPDVVTCVASSGTFNTSQVASANLVTATVTIGGAASSNYTLGAAGTATLSSSASITAHITTKAITATLTAADKIYDGSTSEPNASMSCSLAGVIAADSANVLCAATSGNFNTSQVLTADHVTAAVTISGSASGNYTLGAAGTATPSTSAMATAHITPATVVPHVTAQNKTYDATTTATILTRTLTGVIGTDDVGFTVGSANFADANAGMHKLVTATGLSLTGTTAGNYVLSATTATTYADIEKATPTVSISFAASPITYDGNPHAATVIVTGVSGALSGSDGTVAISYIPGGSSAPVNAGSYSASATFTSTNTNYNDAASSVPASLVINKAPSTTTVTVADATYDGSPHGGTASVIGVGGLSESVSVTYTGISGTVYGPSAVPPTNAGDYSASATFGGDPNHDGSSDNKNFTIHKAASSTVVTVAGGESFTYDGLAHPATVLVTGAGGLGLSPPPVYSCGHAPNNVADSGCTASFNYPGDANHLGSSDSKTYTIAKASSTTTVTAADATYDGSPHGSTANVTGVGGLNQSVNVTYTGISGTVYGPSAVPPTNAGDYSASATFGGDPNHDGSSDTKNFTISKASSTTVVSVAGGESFTYDGLAHPATVLVTGAGGLSLTPVVVYSCGHAPIDVADSGCTASFTFAGDANHLGSSDSKTYTISKASSTTIVTVADATFDGNPHGGAANVTGVGGLNQSVNVTYTGISGTVYGPSATAPTNAGDYSASATFGGDGNHDGSTDTKNFSISKASSTTVVSVAGGESFTYDGLAHPAAVLVTGAGGLSLTPAVAYSCGHAPIDVADSGCIASYTFAGDANHLGSSDSKTYTISTAASTTTITIANATFDGNPHGGSAGVTGAGGLNQSLTITYSGISGTAYGPSTTAPTNAGSYSSSASFAGDANHNSSSDTKTFTIAKAASTTVVTVANATYDGNPHGGSASVTGAGGLNQSLTITYGGNSPTVYGPSTIAPTNAGSYSASASFAGDANHNGSSDTKSFTIAKADAHITVTPYNVIYDGASHTATGNATGVESPTPANLSGLLHLAGTTHTIPGSYTDTWTFDGNGNYNNASGTVNDRISYGVCSAGVGPGGVILPPINSDGSSVYQRKGGSTIPVKFTVCDASGNPIGNPAAVFAGTGGTLTMLSAVRGTVDAANESTMADIPDVAFRWTGSQWIFNMATSNLTQGTTYIFSINLASGKITFQVGVK